MKGQERYSELSWSNRIPLTTFHDLAGHYLIGCCYNPQWPGGHKTSPLSIKYADAQDEPRDGLILYTLFPDIHTGQEIEHAEKKLPA